MENLPSHVRLSKLMSERGICSRREADVYIESGQVLVDGKIVSTLGTKVSPDVSIKLLPKAQNEQNKKVTILLNKPLGYVSTQPEKGYREALELILGENQEKSSNTDPELKPSHLKKLAVAGRLDIDSKGLLVFSQDGTLVKQLIGPLSELEKEYIVRVAEEVTPSMIEKLSFGLELDGRSLKRARVDLLEPSLIRFCLKEGKKRQIRRMCELVGLKVIGLKRVRIGKVCLGNLPEGKWRFLKPDESFF
jgi:23S rRNA pseudouridine2604 synthase